MPGICVAFVADAAARRPQMPAAAAKNLRLARVCAPQRGPGDCASKK